MALNAPSKPARGRPTVGRKIAFHVPLPASKGSDTKNFDKTDQIYARIYCKDSVGHFLGLPLANYRKLLTAPKPPVGGGEGDGAPEIIRAVSDRVSAKQYTLTLLPGTTVKQGKYIWYKGEGADDGFPDEVEIKSLQFSLPGYMPVWRLLDWLVGHKDSYNNGTTDTEPLPGMNFENYNKIIALTTPALRTYGIRSLLYEDPVPPPIAGELDAPGENNPGP